MDSTDTKLNRLDLIQQSAHRRGNQRLEWYAGAQLRIEAARDLALHGVTSDTHLRDAETLLLMAGEESLEHGDVAEYLRTQTEALFVEAAVYGPVVLSAHVSDGQAAAATTILKLAQLHDGLKTVTIDTLTYLDSLRREGGQLSRRLRLQRPSSMLDSLRYEIDLCRGLLQEQTFYLLMNDPTDGKQLAVPSGFYADALERPSRRNDAIYMDAREQPFERHVQIKTTITAAHKAQYDTSSISMVDARDMGNTRRQAEWPQTSRDFITTRIMTQTMPEFYPAAYATRTVNGLRQRLRRKFVIDATSMA